MEEAHTHYYNILVLVSYAGEVFFQCGRKSHLIGKLLKFQGKFNSHIKMNNI